MLKHVKRNAGYTIDQTILIVAIIAILITLIIGTVGWDLVNRASGTKLASQLNQLENAAGQFFAQWRVWPHQGYTDDFAVSGVGVTPDLTVAMLTGPNSDVTPSPSVVYAETTNYLTGLPTTLNAGRVASVQHRFGGGGNVQAAAIPVASLGGGTYLTFMLTNVPIAEAMNADKDIDAGAGGPGNEYFNGRVVYEDLGGDCLASVPASGDYTGDQNVDLCYHANLVQ